MTDRGIGGTGTDDLNEARGVIFGFIASAAFWAVLIYGCRLISGL